MTPEEASNSIEEAIARAMESNSDYRDGDILVDWVVVGYAANPDREVGGAYPIFFPSGRVPDYRPIGLLTYALNSNLGED